MEAHHPPPSIRQKVRRERLERLKISSEEGCDKFAWVALGSSEEPCLGTSDFVCFSRLSVLLVLGNGITK